MTTVNCRVEYFDGFDSRSGTAYTGTRLLHSWVDKVTEETRYASSQFPWPMAQKEIDAHNKQLQRHIDQNFTQ